MRENKDLHDELRTGQEKLRMSSQQHNQLLMEFNEYKNQLGG